MNTILKPSDSFWKKIGFFTAAFFLFVVFHTLVSATVISKSLGVEEGDRKALLDKCKEIAYDVEANSNNLQVVLLEGAAQIRASLSKAQLLNDYFTQIAYNFICFFLLAFLFRKFAFGSIKRQKDWSFGAPLLLILAPFLFMLSFPIIGQSIQLNELLQFDWIYEKIGLDVNSWSLANMIYGYSIFLPMDKTQLVLAVIAVGLIPAVGEELFFRGTLQRMIVEKFGNIHNAIFVTSFIFSALHFDMNAFFYRFFLGVLLGYVYCWSRSIWPSIIIHFLNNSMSIISIYLFTNTSGVDLTEIDKGTPDPISMISLLLMTTASAGFVLYIYYQHFKKTEPSVE